MHIAAKLALGYLAFKVLTSRTPATPVPAVPASSAAVTPATPTMPGVPPPMGNAPATFLF